MSSQGKTVAVSVIALAFSVFFMTDGRAALISDGKELYRKRCSGCHPSATALKSSENIVYLMRNPPPGMPMFDEERVLPADAKAIDDFIVGPGLNPASTPPADARPAAAPVVLLPSSAGAARLVPGSGQRLNVIRLSKDKTANLPRFLKKWTIKGLWEGDVLTLQILDLFVNAKGELSVAPANKFNNNLFTVTGFDIDDKQLTVELSWTIKGRPSYWKREAYVLTMADGGGKLSGTYTMENSGGGKLSRPVWGE